jgi:hypothetical protein
LAGFVNTEGADSERRHRVIREKSPEVRVFKFRQQYPSPGREVLTGGPIFRATNRVLESAWAPGGSEISFWRALAMFKKMILGVLIVGLLGGIVLGRGAWSYLTTGYERAAQTVEDQVPMEFQIDRARKMVRDLEPEIRRSMHVIAKEEVEVESLDKRIGAAETKATQDKSEIIRLQSDLQTGKSVFRYAGHEYTANEVKQDLSRRFVRFKTTDATLGSLVDMRDARQRNLEAARDKLAAMMSAQRQLQVDVENLEAKLKLVEVAQASSDLKLDDSQLARAKELITDIRTKLDVAAKLASADTNFKDEIQLDEPADENITDQVAEYFKLDSSDETEVAVVNYQEK